MKPQWQNSHDRHKKISGENITEVLKWAMGEQYVMFPYSYH